MTVGKVCSYRSGFHLYLISNLQKNNTDHVCLTSFLENIDIDNFFFVRNGRWPESARKSKKRQNINGVPIVTQAENTSKLPKNTERSESKVTSKLPTGVLKEMV